MQRIYLCLFVLLAGNLLIAQDCRLSISGYVLDRATKEPLGYSVVGITELATGAIADSSGYFKIGELCPGSYHIQIDHLGCTSVKKFLYLQNDTSFTVLLEHHDELLREIIVEGKPLSANESQSSQLISSDAIKAQTGQTLSDITEKVSGVQSLRNGSGISKPVIHGLYGNRIAVVNNGLLQAGQQWGADHAPEIDPNSANVITVVKGTDAIEYGTQALGGAVIVDAGPALHDPHLHGTLGYVFETNGLGHTLYGKASQSFDKIDLRLTATLKKEGDHRTPSYFLTNTGVFESNASGQLIYQVNQRIQHQLYYSLFHSQLGVFAGAHISNLTDLQQAIGREEPFNISDKFSYSINPPRQDVTHHLLKYAGKNFITNESSIEWLYGVQLNHREEFDIRRGGRSEIPALDLRLWAHALEFKYVNQLRKFKYKAGIQGKWFDNTNSAETGILPLIPDYLEGSAALFINSQFPLGKLLMETGARYDLQTLQVWAISRSLPREIIKMDHIYHDYALSAGFVYKASENSETRFNSMLVRRSPEVNELYSSGLHQGVAGIEEGDWTLAPEISLKSIFTQSFRLWDFLHLELSGFYHFIEDYIYLKPTEELRLTIRGAFPVYVYDQDDAVIRGIDFAFVSDLTERLELSGQMSLMEGYRAKDKTPLTLMPPANFSSNISWALKDTWKWRGTRWALKMDYVASQNQWDESAEFLDPPGGYFLLSGKFETGVQISSNMLQFGFYADNLLNRRYRNYLNRLRYFAIEEGRSVRVNIRYEF